MNKVIQGNNIDILKTYPDNTFDSIVTDPPYGIEFLSKEWDSNTGAVETWAECFRVLKPGGYILAFSAARTYHNLATNIEGVGFEIRDQIMWLYASGFPKAQDMGKAIDKRAGKYDDKYGTTTSQTGERGINTHGAKGMGSRRCNKCKNDVAYQYECKDTECGMKYNYGTDLGKQWAGWKTALKPAHEPIVMARKPYKGSCVDNVLTHGVGALNIDATRVDWDEEATKINKKYNESGGTYIGIGIDRYNNIGGEEQTIRQKVLLNDQGRFPSNVIGEVEDYQKFFYCPKVSRAERHIGFESPPEPIANYSTSEVKNHPLWDPSIGTNLQRLKHKILEHNKDLGKQLETHGINVMGKTPYCGDCEKTFNGTNLHTDCDPALKTFKEKRSAKITGNNHPTVKPVALMKYLIKLVTPAGGSVLDPFTGSGSTGMAAVELGYDFTGCELDPDYVAIADARITAWANKTDLNNNPLPAEWFTEDE